MSDQVPVLRLVDRPSADGRRTVAVTWQPVRRTARETGVEVDVTIDPGVAEKVRWYLEDYGEFTAEPAPTIAAETEEILAEQGRALFTAVFGAGAGRDIWAQARLDGLDAARVEVDADPGDVPGLPWELLRDPTTDRPLVVTAGEFVRTHRQAVDSAPLPEPDREHLRVLLVICRPEGGDDVAFRSVASRLVRGGADRLDTLDLDVLRPATFARLREVLRQARDHGKPYHVVHFDGHGTYLDVTASDPDDDRSGTGGGGAPMSPLRYGLDVAGQARRGRHGYLLFESPNPGPTQRGSNQQLVDGPTLAALLVDTGVPVLVLNACRSAYTEAPETPDTGDADSATADVHDRIRAYGSLAAEVADAGVPGVVAMRYNVYVVTAAQFVADLYTGLLGGRSLGRAATLARQTLHADPTREIGAEPVALQDWVVPTVYEAAPLTLHSSETGPASLQITVGGSGTAVAGGVPRAPDVGFFGRDETLLALDRAFDTARIVLLHALAGAGKSSTAAEFTRWYVTTGGLDGPDGQPGLVLWTSFEHYLPLPRVLDVVGTAFAPLLERSGVHWAAITDPDTRRDLVLQLLGVVPVLWVWDNVEPVAGFPTGTRSAWTDTEQHELVEFLRDLTDTRAKVLLTSRRAEDRWLAGLPVRVALPPMPMRERLQLAYATARHHHSDTGAMSEAEWRPLLRFTGGNPLTITVTVRQALREHAHTADQMEAFVARVQAGHTPLEVAEDTAQGRDTSLAASLAYGFDHAFTEPERAQLAVLHLFRDTVDIDALRFMGDPAVAETDAVAALAGATRDGLTALLDRAVEVGLLTGYGAGYYAIHPALPWFFTTLYTHNHPHTDTDTGTGRATGHTAQAVERAYARAYAALGDYYARQVELEGRAAEVLPVLRAEEANLLHALALARTHQDPRVALGCLLGLYQLYALTGRDVEWARLVDDIQGDYLDPATDQPRPGRDDQYSVVMGYRVRIAQNRRDWPTATRLQTTATAWDRRRADPYLHLPADRLDATARHHLRTLAVSEQDLGRILRDQGDPACLDHYRAAHDLNERIGDTTGQAIAASNLGNAYLQVPELRDLDQAQHWHQQSLDLKPDHNRIGRAAAHGSLGNVAYERFLDARAAGAPDTELLTHLNDALTGYQQALDLTPPDHHDYRATGHNQLGLIYWQAGDVRQSLHHYQKSIQHKEARGDTYGAGRTRYNIALLLDDAGRPEDALHYAGAALDNYRTVGPGAAAIAEQAQALIDHLKNQG